MIEKLLESEELKRFRDAVVNGDDLVFEGLWDAPKALLSVAASQLTGKHLVILTGRTQEEATLYHDLKHFSDRPIIDFPAWETLPSERVPPSPDIVGERYKTLDQLLSHDQPIVIITSLQATLQKLIEPSEFKALHLQIRKGDEVGFELLIEQLQAMGYERRPVASDKGEIAVRGNIIDLFPVSSPDPFRIEFWGDTVESIRIYDPIGQKSVRLVETFSIHPAKELELLEKAPKLATLLDYLGQEAILVFDDVLALEDRYAQLTGMQHKNPHFLQINELLEQMEKQQKFFWSETSLRELSPVKTVKEQSQFELFQQDFTAKILPNPFMRVSSYLRPENAGGSLSEEEVIDAVRDPYRKQESWVILATSESERKAVTEKVNHSQVDLHIENGYLSSGFVLPKSQVILLPMTEITHRMKIRRQKQRSTYHTPPSETYELNPGDLVVHLQQGLGRFIGMERRPDIHGHEAEFFLLEYANGSKLFVPMSQAHLITKYIGSSEETPKLHEMGSSKWKRAKEKTQAAITAYAKELIDLYAKRSIAKGFAYETDSDDLLAFEDEFPFEETGDQLRAIELVKKDMTSDKVMDRLVCGDVGYGKTEVAMRAAVKAVLDGGKQVALLVPTTVLAMQHFENFVDRMRDFPIRIGVLSRFVKPKEIKKTVEGAANGSIDIIVGTHRIISKDIEFKNLGLVIIDEEQRFGVKAKEHLKKAKAGVDCLTLSATPIPRTLYLSLMGARDLSVINTPPQDRVPIKTVIAEMNEELIQSAIKRELARDGQCFVIHNRVETIFDLAATIKKQVPEARVIVGHGQMTPDEIDKVFHQFKTGEADVLVATTIVENGIDIPNANTILIDRSDRFGLAELYQLRGRVGRWNRRAYCYFLVPKLSTLPEISRKRLAALAETSGYGGGMKVALRDLEIRGAGNVLGEEQSGQVETIGFHQYCKWLKRAVNALKGGQKPTFADVKVECKMDARIPADYIEEVSLRMEFYQRFGEAVTVEEVEEIQKELVDRFGPAPEPVDWLVSLSKIKTVASNKGFSKVEIGIKTVTLEKVINKKPSSWKTLFQAPEECKAWEEALLQLLELTP